MEENARLREPGPKQNLPYQARDKEKEEKKGLIIFLNVNGPILSCIERFFVLYTTLRKDQPPMYRTIFLPREGGPPYDAMDGCPKCKG